MTMTDKRKQYTDELKESIIKRMMPPNNESVSKISEETGVTEPTLYKWRKQARIKGQATPGNGQSSEQWSSEDKFLIVMETYSLNEVQLAEYCRRKGLFKEQVKAWRDGCLNANSPKPVHQTKQLNHELKEEKSRAKILEKDLRKKEKALAEAAALLLLRKKAQAIWGDQEDE